VRAILLQPDGQVLIVGSFDHIDGKAVPGVARLNGGVLQFEFRSVARLTGGRTQLQFSMPRGQIHLLQISSNLVDWLDLNLVIPLRDQTDFTDSNSTPGTQRFYRARRLP
jgi:hypothetical protein